MNDIPSITEQTLTKYKSAWLITWEWAGEHAKVENKVVAILDFRYSHNKIGRFLEWIYIGSRFALYEQIAYAKNRKYNPYRLEYCVIELRASKESGLPSSIPYTDRMIFGNNPWLYARIVYDLQGYIDEQGRNYLKWKERVHLYIKNGKIESDWEECELVR